MTLLRAKLKFFKFYLLELGDDPSLELELYSVGTEHTTESRSLGDDDGESI